MTNVVRLPCLKFMIGHTEANLGIGFDSEMQRNFSHLCTYSVYGCGDSENRIQRLLLFLLLLCCKADNGLGDTHSTP